MDTDEDFSLEPRRQPPRSGKAAFLQLIENTEKNVAKRLGTSEHLQRWKRNDKFRGVRKEWQDALNLFAERHGLAAVLKVRAGIHKTSKGPKSVALVFLRLVDKPEETLKRNAGTIYAAACEGDVDFFNAMGLALRSRGRRKGRDGFLTWNLLIHWFAGRLWEMNNEAGFQALQSYTGQKFEKQAYRKAVSRLNLKGHPARKKSRLRFNPKKKVYC